LRFLLNEANDELLLREEFIESIFSIPWELSAVVKKV